MSARPTPRSSLEPTDAAPPSAEAPDATPATAPAGASPATPPGHPEAHPRGRRLALLTLTALGVVYGDIGTSPLYTIKEIFGHAFGLAPTRLNVYGTLSLILWSLVLVVVVKYLTFILRADNRGEGGVLAMLALVLGHERHEGKSPRRRWLILLGIFGTALLFGDGIITPAISVLGAMEGLEVATPALQPYVVGVSVGILLALFLFQRFGTARVGRTFGPITLAWFVTIGLLGLREVVRSPHILLAANPLHAVRFFVAHGFLGFTVLGSVFLAVTGAEALYADLGHFGKRPIRVAFLVFVFPALVLNYFGQGALLLRDPSAVAHPFFHLASGAFLYPLLVIATLAAVVASQALISGAFSLARQAVQLGYSPRLTIVHTSEEEHGQIYVPEVNTALMIGTLFIVLAFRSTAALGAAYGIAVTGTMFITTLLFAWIARRVWRWSAWRVATVTAMFLILDLSFLGANLLKVVHGGWVPLVIALVLLVVMTTWKTGRELLRGVMESASLPLDLLLDDVGRRPPPRVPGTAVFLTSDTEGAPVVLLHHLKHNKALHRQVVLLSIVPEEVPEVPDAERVRVVALPHGFFRVLARSGFMEVPDVPHILALCAAQGLVAKPRDVSYYLGRERLIAVGRAPMARWRKRLFVFLSRNAQSATQFFGLPANRVVELGAQIEL